jgi:hypothetical protein
VGDAHPEGELREVVKLPKLIEFPPEAIVTYSMAEETLPIKPRAKRPRVEFEQPPVLVAAVDRSPNPPYEPVEAIVILLIVI